MEISSYPLFDHAPYALSLAVKMMQVAEAENLDLLHVHYAIPHSVSALLARMMAAPRRLPFITTLHGTDITLVGNDRSFLPITKFSIEQSDGVTAISHYLKQRTLEEFDIKRPIEVIPNFVNCDLYCRKPNPALRAEWAPDGEPILMHLSNFRPVKRVTDVIEIFALVREKMRAKLVLIGDGPDRGAAEYLVRKKKLGARRAFPRQAGPRLPTSCRRRTCSCCPRTWNRSAWRRSRPWPAKFRWWPRTWAACRKWSSTESTDIFLRRGKWKSAQDTPWKFCRGRIAAAQWDKPRASMPGKNIAPTT